MAKSKQKAVKEPHAPAPDPTSSPTTFKFVGLNVTEVVFKTLQLKPVPDGEHPPAAGAPANIEVSAAVGVNDQKISQLSLRLTIVTDARLQPYEIVVNVLGTFTTENGTAEQLGQFCRTAAPGILFPYIREIVDRTTTYAPYGPVRLDPMNINQFVNQTPWSDAPPQPGRGGASKVP